MRQSPDNNSPLTPGDGGRRPDGSGLLVYLLLGVVGVPIAFFVGWFILANLHPGVAVNLDTGIGYGIEPDDYRDPANSTVASAERTPRWMPDGQTIVVGMEHGIYQVRADDTSTKQNIIEMKNRNLYSPSLQADGSKIAFLSYRQTGNPFRPPNLWHIWIADADGRKSKRITKLLPYLSHPYLSPDGSLVALIPGDGPCKATVIATDGSSVTESAPSTVGSYSSRAAWSSDSRRLALSHWWEYLTVFDWWERLTVFDLDTGTCNTIVEVSGPHSYVSTPAWAPSNDRLYYVGRDGGIDSDKQPTEPTYLYSVRFDGADRQVIAELSFDGTGRRVLADLSKGDLPPIGTLDLSPDGQRLLLVGTRFRGSINEVYVMNIDGTELRMIYESPQRISVGSGPAQVIFASWSPDGSQVAVHSPFGDRVFVLSVP